MSLYPVGQTAQLCSGCGPQMTPVVEENTVQEGVYFADQYIVCDPRMQCCLSPLAGVKSANVKSWWSNLSLASSGAAIGALALSRPMREAWKDSLMERYIKEIEEAFRLSRIRSGVDTAIERERGAFYSEVMRYNLEWYKRAGGKEWKQKYLKEARGSAEKAAESFRLAYLSVAGRSLPTARDFLNQIRILKREVATLKAMSEIDKDFKPGELKKAYEGIAAAARQAVAEIERGDVVAKALAEKHLLPIVLAEQVEAMRKLKRYGEDYDAAHSKLAETERPTLALLNHLDLLNPEDRDVALEALNEAGIKDIGTTSELMEALAFGKLRSALKKEGIVSEVISRLERSANDHLAASLDLRRSDEKRRRSVK